MDHIWSKLWNAAAVPQILVGLFAVGLVAVALAWYWRADAASREQTQADRQNDRGQTSRGQSGDVADGADASAEDPVTSSGPDPGGTKPIADRTSHSDETKPHPESLTRERAVANSCGTIGVVTPMPASTSMAPGGGGSHEAGAGSPQEGDAGTPRELTSPSGGPPRLDPALAEAVELAREAAENESLPGADPIGSPVLTLPVQGDSAVGEHVDVQAEDEDAATHYFESHFPAYTGWRWAVTVARAGTDEPVTVSEVVLLPGPEALTAPEWLPWNERVRPGDLGAGDLLPSGPQDPRLVPSHVASGDPVLDELGGELGLGRERVLSHQGRTETARRWQAGEFGPDSEMASLAPGACGTCGFFLSLAGSLSAGFGVCANEVSPADGRVVHVEFGCGAHSEAEVDVSSTVPVAEVVYDDTTLDYESRDDGSRRGD